MDKVIQPTRKKEGNQGIMVALMIPEEIGKQIALEDGTPVSELHVTLAYPGKIDELPEDTEERLVQAVTDAVEGMEPIKGKISGLGRFNASDSSDGMDVLYLSLDSSALGDLRERIVARMEEIGIPAKTNHGFTPHITLAYIAKDSDLPIQRSPEHDVTFDAVTVVIGDEMTPVKLGSKASESDSEGQSLGEAEKSLLVRCQDDEYHVSNAIDAYPDVHINHVAVLAKSDPESTRFFIENEPWEHRWHKALTKNGLYVLHSHWTGLTKEESDKSNQELLKSGAHHHMDLRMEGENSLWGLTILDPNSSVEYKSPIAWKSGHSKQWISVGKDEPLIVEPNDVDEENKACSKFVREEIGAFEVGMVTKDQCEIRFTGKKLLGRFIIENTPVSNGKRAWMISKPKDQRMISETYKKDEMIKLMRRGKDRGRWLYWSGELIDLRKQSKSFVLPPRRWGQK